MSFRATLLGCAVLSTILAACAAPSEETLATEDELQTLVPQQIEEIGEFMPSTAKFVTYSGHRRYVGFRTQVEKGVKIDVTAHIEQFAPHPVVAVADSRLRVLARHVGGNISGAPGHSFSSTDAVAPEAGTYWVLFGEDARQPHAIEIGWAMKRSAGVVCHHDNMCLSESCVAHRCAVVRPSSFPNTCIVDADCSTARCSDPPPGSATGACQVLADGETCKVAEDCEHDNCEGGRCACIRAGAPATHPRQCCSSLMTGTVCGG